eukprot:scaffold10244_cov82-Phaeocystis_antarctica.AAC.3
MRHALSSAAKTPCKLRARTCSSSAARRMLPISACETATATEPLQSIFGSIADGMSAGGATATRNANTSSERKASTGERDGLNARDTDVARQFDARFKPRLIPSLARHVATFTQSSGAHDDRTLPGIAATQARVEPGGFNQRVGKPTGAPDSHGVVGGAMANDEATAAARKFHPGGHILRTQPAEFR